MKTLARRVGTIAAAALMASPIAAVTAPTADAAVPAISASSFGMHWLHPGQTAWPALSFGTARIWDMGVTWSELQPSATSTFDSTNPAVARLDAIVNAYRSHHV